MTRRAIMRLVSRAAPALMGFLCLSVQADELRLGLVTPPSHTWNQIAARFNDNLRVRTGGEFQIRVYPLGKLGGDEQMIYLLQSGAIELGLLTAGVVSNMSEPLNAWFLPYQFADVSDAARATRSAPAQRMLADLEDYELVGLGYTLAGMRHVITVSPVHSLEDLRNKRIRAFPNTVFRDWWSALGAAPTVVSIGDLSSSLTTNLLDGVDVDLDIVVGLKLYQQAPHLTPTNHMAFPGVAVASRKWWQSLSADDRRQVLLAFEEAEAWGFARQAQAEIENLMLLENAGVTIGTVDYAELRRLGAEIAAKYTSSHPRIECFYRKRSDTGAAPAADR